MEGKRISHEVGKGSLTHNNRVFSAKNIDPTRTPQNVVLVNIPLEEAYRTLFDGAIERYNNKQTRKCRRIQTDYFTHLFNHKICEYTIIGNNKQKSFYEDLVQVGTMHDTGCGTPDAEIAKQCLQEYMEHYLKNNPNFFVFNAVIHMDEATPHLHIDYIPIGHYKTGIDTRNAMAQALAEMGYTGKDAAIKWRAHERQVFTEICESHGFVIAPPEESRGHSFTCEEYREIQEEKKRLNEELTPLREMELVAEETVVIGKKQLLSHNITVSPEEFEQLETQKKAVAVQSIEIKRKSDNIEHRKQELDKREAEISVKESESLSHLAYRSSELDKREEKVRSSERRVSDAANAVEIEKMKLQDLEAKAEKKLKAAENEYNEQIELTERNILVENITFVNKNCRYSIHDECGNSEGAANTKHIFRNCRFYNDNTISCIGVGTVTGYFEVENCYTENTTTGSFFLHDWVNSTGGNLIIKNCVFNSESGIDVILSVNSNPESVFDVYLANNIFGKLAITGVDTSQFSTNVFRVIGVHNTITTTAVNSALTNPYPIKLY